MPSIHKPLALLLLLTSASFASPLSLGSAGDSLESLRFPLASSDSKHARSELASSPDNSKPDRECQDFEDRWQDITKVLEEVRANLDDMYATVEGARKNGMSREGGGLKDRLDGKPDPALLPLQADLAKALKDVGEKPCDVPARVDKDQAGKGKEDGGSTRPGVEVDAEGKA